MSIVLQLLQQSCMRVKEAREITINNETYISFGELSYLKDSSTNLKVYETNEYYSIEEILLFCDLCDAPYNCYIDVATRYNIRAVSEDDRGEIRPYMMGYQNRIPNIFDRTRPSPKYFLTKELEFYKTSVPESERNGEQINICNENVEFGNTNGLRPLNEKLTTDVIAALKKRKRKHQEDKINELNRSGMNMTTENDDYEDDYPRRGETVWRPRKNFMESGKRNFDGLLNYMKELKECEEAQAQKKSLCLSNPGTPLSLYSRYNQEIYTKQDTEFSIDPEMTFVGVKMDASKSGEPRPLSRVSSVSDQPEEPPHRIPIIIIPPMETSMITVYNVRDLLQDMKFVSSDEKKMSTKQREKEVMLYRKKGEVTVPYLVIDDPIRLTDEEWDRVVAVFVMGPRWHLRGWKFGGDPEKIFANIAAFHVHYDDMKVDANIVKWNVTTIPISKNKRHVDRVRLVKFWEVVERHIIKKKPHLRQ